MLPRLLHLPLTMLPQPDETTCGPTCLHAVYRYWGDDLPLEAVIDRSHALEHGGTFVEFLRLGGRLRFTDLSPPLIRGLLRRGCPSISGLSSTFLYRTAREYSPTDIVDDVCGTPSGHFVVIAGYDRAARRLLVSDPCGPHPYGGSRDYWTRMDRVFNAILLGIVTHDANLLVLSPRREDPGAGR
jgi:hypothetical protein